MDVMLSQNEGMKSASLWTAVDKYIKIYTHLRACRQISGKDQTNSECGEISPNKPFPPDW